MNIMTIEKYCDLIKEHIDVSRMNHKKVDMGKIMFWANQIKDFSAQAIYFDSIKKSGKNII